MSSDNPILLSRRTSVEIGRRRFRTPGLGRTPWRIRGKGSIIGSNGAEASRTETATFHAEGEAHHLPVHGRGRVRYGHVRIQT